MKTEKLVRGSMILLIFALSSAPLFSQVKFGVRAEVGLNNPSFNTEALQVDNMTSYSIGPSIEALFPFAVVDFGIEASLLYNDNRMTVANLTGETDGPEQNVSNRYLNLPLNAKVKFGLGALPLKLFATAGPYAGYLISEGETIQEIGDNIKAKSFQAGANIGAGLEILNMIQVGVNYRVQLTDNYAADTPNWEDPLNGKTDSWNITAAIYF